MSASPCGTWSRAPNSGWRRRSKSPASAPPDISAHLKSATLVRSPTASRCCATPASRCPDEVLVTDETGSTPRSRKSGFPLVMKIQSRDIPHKSEVGGVRVNITTKGEAFAAYQMLLDNARTSSAQRRDPGRAGRADGEKGRRDHRRHPDGCDLRPDGHGRPRRHHHGIVQGRGLSARAGERCGGARDAGRTQGRAVAERIPRARRKPMFRRCRN